MGKGMEGTSLRSRQQGADSGSGATKGKTAEVEGRALSRNTLWKIGGEYYNLWPYLDQHPGGRSILEYSIEFFPDATEAFESFHLNQEKVRKIMKRYHVPRSEIVDEEQWITKGMATDRSHKEIAEALKRKQEVRPNKLTSEKDFYYVLRQRVHEMLKAHGGIGPKAEAIWMFWITSFLHFVLYGMLIMQQRVWVAPFIVLTSGILGGFGHNWVHQPKYKSWAIIGLDLVGFSSENWFREHLLQHHIYTNTPEDNHFHGTDPFLLADPTRPRSWFNKLCAVLMPVILFFGAVGNFLIMQTRALKGAEQWRWSMGLYPCLYVVLMSSLGLVRGFLIQLTISGVMSIWYFTIALMNHNTNHTLQGKNEHAADWGLAQLHVCSDIGTQLSFFQSARYLWLNYHTVHHLFPTTDMSKHPEIQRVLIQTCEEFGVEYYCPGFWEGYFQIVHNFMVPMRPYLPKALH